MGPFFILENMMKKFWIAILITLVPPAQAAELKTLSYDYNDIVRITIANAPCPSTTLAKTHPYVAIAVKFTDKNRTQVADTMNACWTNKGDDIEIQWVGGDKSLFPANYFLVKATL